MNRIHVSYTVIRAMRRMGFRWREIGDLFNVSGTAAYMHMHRYETGKIKPKSENGLNILDESAMEGCCYD